MERTALQIVGTNAWMRKGYVDDFERLGLQYVCSVRAAYPDRVHYAHLKGHPGFVARLDLIGTELVFTLREPSTGTERAAVRVDTRTRHAPKVIVNTCGMVSVIVHGLGRKFVVYVWRPLPGEGGDAPGCL